MVLRKMREAAGLTQVGLAAELKVHRSVIGRAESGARVGGELLRRWLAACGADRPARLEAVAGQLGVTVGDLMRMMEAE